MTEHHIQRLGHLGDGIAEGPVFAPLTLPGEVVTGQLEGQALKDVRIVTPSVDRVAPPCRHFKACGGCQLQHAADPFVAQWKTDVVATALAAQGLKTDMRPIVTSPAASRRRASFSAKRTKKGAMAGFHVRASDVVIEIPGCTLLDPAVLAAREIAVALAEVGTSRKAELAVTVTQSQEGPDIAVSNGKPLDGALRQQLGQLAEAHRIARLTWDDETVSMRAPPVQMFGDVRVTPPPGAFLQATLHGEAALLTAVNSAIGDAGAVMDLFAGCGTFSLPIASGARVHAVEGDKAMCAALEEGWRMAKGLKPVTVEARDLFRRPMLPDELAKFDAVVLDPPRAGAEAQVAELAKSEVMDIAFVSCNPTTFARDAATLVAAGYRLNWVQTVDQFRWSSHIELAAHLSKRHIGAS
jgi:23S rRNA (uracil1939-C5)-methyltransferase